MHGYYIPWCYIIYKPNILCIAIPYKNSSDHPELIAFGNVVRSIHLDRGISQEALAGAFKSHTGVVRLTIIL